MQKKHLRSFLSAGKWNISVSQYAMSNGICATIHLENFVIYIIYVWLLGVQMSRNGNKDQPLILRRDLAKSRKEKDKLGLNFIKSLCKRVKQSLIEIHAEIEDGFLENVSLRVS